MVFFIWTALRIVLGFSSTQNVLQVLVSAQLVIVSCSLSQESELHHPGAVVLQGDGGVQQLVSTRQERSLLNTFPFTQAQEIQSTAR